MSASDDFERLLQDRLGGPDLELDSTMRRRLLAAAAAPLPQTDNIIPFEPPARREAFDWLVGESPATPPLLDRLMGQPAFLAAVEDERRFVGQLRAAMRAGQNATTATARRSKGFAIAAAALAASFALLAGALWQAAFHPQLAAGALTNPPSPATPTDLGSLPAPAAARDPISSTIPIAAQDRSQPAESGPWVDSRRDPSSIAASGRSVMGAIPPDFLATSPAVSALAAAAPATFFPEEETPRLAHRGTFDGRGSPWDFRSSFSDSECLHPGIADGSGPEDIGVPEPAVAGLFIIGAALATLPRKRRSQRAIHPRNPSC